MMKFTSIPMKTSEVELGYDTCPTVSRSHEDHKERLINGNPVLPKFDAWSADLETVAFCCTSGECAKCRDSQVISSWLLVNSKKFLALDDGLRIWTEIAESYFSQFIWSPYHPYNQSISRATDEKEACLV